MLLAWGWGRTPGLLLNTLQRPCPRHSCPLPSASDTKTASEAAILGQPKRAHVGVCVNTLPTASHRPHGRSQEPPRERDLWLHSLGCSLETLRGS